MKRPALFVITCLLAPVGVAQAQVITGNIIGAVRNESGGALPGMTVTLTSPVLPSAGLTVVAGTSGDYRFTELSPRTYSLKCIPSRIKGARLEFSSQAGTIATDRHSYWRIGIRNDLCRPSERALDKLIRFVVCDEGDALVVVTKLDGEGIQAAEFSRCEERGNADIG